MHLAFCKYLHIGTQYCKNFSCVLPLTYVHQIKQQSLAIIFGVVNYSKKGLLVPEEFHIK